MSQTIEITDVCGYMKRHLVDVFDTMLTRKAALAPEATPPHHAERVTGSVGFAGESVTGAVYLHLSAPFAKSAAATMLGIPAEELGDAEVNDVVGEVTNMLTGGLKSWLCDAGSTCAVSTPAIIRGAAFAIEAMPEVQHTVQVFQCGDDQISVEIHIKFI